MKKILSYSKYVLLFIFLGVVLYAFYLKPDPIFLVLGLFMFGSGISTAQSLDEFGASIERYKQAGDNVIKAFDTAIEEEKKKKKKRVIMLK